MVALLPQLLGRPLNIVSSYLGLMISDGGFIGLYAVLGAIAVAQLGASLWAIAPLMQIRLLRWTVALAVALHPWWPAGDILRFQPAQMSVLFFVIWLGMAVRFMASGRAAWAPLLFLVPLMGLLTYQALAAALLLGAVLVALTTSTHLRRGVALVLLAVGSSVSTLIWSVVLAPRLSTNSYESHFVSAPVDVLASIRSIARTIVLHAPLTLIAMLVVATVVTTLGFTHRLTPARAWLLLGGVAVAPLAALAYAAEPLHLNDPERVALPTGAVVWIVLCCTLPALDKGRATRLAATSTILVGTLACTLVGYQTWSNYSIDQEQLIHAVQSVRSTLPDNARIIVADNTGKYGDVYTLLPPHLKIALDAVYGPGADAELCTPSGVSRDHPTADLFPIATTRDCDDLLVGKDAKYLGAIETDEGPLELFRLDPAG